MVLMTVTVRRLTENDDDDARRLCREAFGAWDEPEPPPSLLDRPGMVWWGVQDGAELVAVAADREYDSWFGGARFPTAGIAAVSVAAEHRGRGLLKPLLEAMLSGSRDRGAVLSTLFPSSAGFYRRHGYEIITALDDVRVPTHQLAATGDVVPTRRASPADAEAIRTVYDRWAHDQNGPLTRRGPSFPDDDDGLISKFSGLTVAESADGVVNGFLSWDRGRGFGSEGELRVWDLVANDVASLRSLLGVVASFAPVTPTTLIRTSGVDAWRLLPRTLDVTLAHSAPYMLQVLDVAALEHLHYPQGISARLPFRTAAGGSVLTVQDGRADVTSADEPSARALDASGLALTLAGVQSSANLRRLGHLVGNDSDDAIWDALFGGRQAHVRDYF